jgi:superfamily II DNA or RNA helicase
MQPEVSIGETAAPERMSYFATHYNAVRPPIATASSAGLRRGQLAAIHGLAAHFTLKKEPGIVVLPTGAGKTDVAILLPFLTSATRVLVIAPSEAVRGQLSARYASLSVLKSMGVLLDTIPLPKVKKLKQRILNTADWEQLREFDVVVTTPNSMSPVLKGVAPPPEDFFDLLIIDEAHHSPAKTWQAILEAFPNAKRALFTATPFRRDRKQINGTIVANYSILAWAKNRTKSKVRAKVEHVFPVMKLKFGFVKVRYRGLKKNAHRLFVTCALVNLFVSRKKLLLAAA